MLRSFLLSEMRRKSLALALLLAGCADEPLAPSAPVTSDCREGQRLSLVSGSLRAHSSVGEASAQVCLRLVGGASLCLQPQRAGQGGDFAISVPEELGCVEHAAVRLWSSEPSLASIYCPLTAPSPEISLSPAWLPSAPSAALPPIADEDTPHALLFDDGLSVTLAPSALRFERGSYETMGAKRLSDTAPAPCFVAPGQHLDGLYAFSVEADIEGPASVVIPNATGLPAGAKVALYVLGTQWCTLASGERIDEGELRRFGEARVSLDGERIEGGDAEGGLPCLGWLGYGVDEGS